MKQGKLFTVSVALIVAVGGFVWGFDATVISGAVPFIQKYFDLNGDRGDFLLGLAVSCLGWGVLGGTAVSGFFSDRFGRKKVLITTAVLFAVNRAALGADDSFCGLCRRAGSGRDCRGRGHSDRAGLYRRNCAAETAREPGLAQPIDDCARHFSVLFLQLFSGQCRREQLALDAGHGCRSGDPVFLSAVFRAGKPPLAVWPGPTSSAPAKFC